MVSKILVFALIVGTASAATWTDELLEKPTELAYKEGCYIEALNDVIPFGTTVTPLGNCVRIHCTSTFLYYASCDVIFTSNPQCYLTDTNWSRPYPDCCPIKCDDDNNLF